MAVIVGGRKPRHVFIVLAKNTIRCRRMKAYASKARAGVERHLA